MTPIRDIIGRFLPSWLADNYPASPSYGFRLMWSLALFIDAGIDTIIQGARASVGKGTPTALEYIGDARGMIRNQDESAEAYAARLPTWVDRAKENGSAYRLAFAIHDYLRTHPRIRIFNRNGICVTVDTDRTVTMVDEPNFDWDSVSHPERNDPDDPWWSDMWIVIYTRTSPDDEVGQWPQRPGELGDLTGDDGFALGHLATQREVDDIKSLIQLCKSNHSCVRAVIWTSDPTKFTPGDAASMPDGTWGNWGMYDGSAYVPSGRDLVTCRFWEPR